MLAWFILLFVGLIPWDDDLDLCVLEEHEDNLNGFIRKILGKQNVRIQRIQKALLVGMLKFYLSNYLMHIIWQKNCFKTGFERWLQALMIQLCTIQMKDTFYWIYNLELLNSTILVISFVIFCVPSYYKLYYEKDSHFLFPVASKYKLCVRDMKKDCIH